MNVPAPLDDGDRTESRDSVLFEFTDPNVDFTPRPPREETLRRAPSWLRERAPTEGAALAGCLLAQARLLLATGQYVEGVSASAEAQRLYEAAGMPAPLADCYHISARLHEALGRSNEALEFLRREAELRRRLSA